jgi:hypothetical protein
MSSRKYVGPAIICRLETGENMSAQFFFSLTRNRKPSQKKIFPEICRPGDNMSAGGAAPEPPHPAPLHPPRGGLHPPLTPPRARRRRSDTTTRAKNITHTQHMHVPKRLSSPLSYIKFRVHPNRFLVLSLLYKFRL